MSVLPLLLLLLLSLVHSQVIIVRAFVEAVAHSRVWAHLTNVSTAIQACCLHAKLAVSLRVWHSCGTCLTCGALFS